MVKFFFNKPESKPKPSKFSGLNLIILVLSIDPEENPERKLFVIWNGSLQAVVKLVPLLEFQSRPRGSLNWKGAKALAPTSNAKVTSSLVVCIIKKYL